MEGQLRGHLVEMEPSYNTSMKRIKIEPVFAIDQMRMRKKASSLGRGGSEAR